MNSIFNSTTGVGCVNLRRKFIGIELDGDCFNIAVDRIEKSKEENL